MGRRVVTGVDADGRSCVLSDGIPDQMRLMRSGADGNLLSGAVTPLSDRQVPGGGEACNVDSWTVTANMLGPGFPDAADAGIVCRWTHTVFGPHTHAHPHSTPTYDVDLIVDGEVDLLLEVGSVTLRQGDTVVIPGVVHGWRTNDRSCWFMCTMYPLHPSDASSR